MEENQERKFVCKYCFKSYPCGKSLGGHIRTHMNGNSSAGMVDEADFPISKLFSKSSEKALMAEAGGQSGYGLRENPKKTKRFVDSGNNPSTKEMFCKECGKGFQSLKALCGHMACHSDKERAGNSKIEDDSGNGENQKMIMDSQSDTETSAMNRGRRSRRMKFKAMGGSLTSTSLANNNSSSASGVEQEQEELAKCLMMLSRDSGGKKGLNSVADSSENNSVVLEAKSSSIDLRITIKNGVKCLSNGAEFLENRRGCKLKSAEFDSSSEESDSGYFTNGPKKVESDVSVDGFLRNVESSKRKFGYGSGFVDLDAKPEKSLSKYECMKSEFGKDLDQVGDSNGAERASTKYDLRRTLKKNSYAPETLCRNSQKGSNRKVNGSYESAYESEADSLETDSFPVRTADIKTGKFSRSKNPNSAHDSSRNPEKRPGLKQSKVHECPFCSRVFKSGQALGGHKRSHFIGTSEDRTVVIKQDSAEMAGLIDLNLPAPVEEDAIENSGFKEW